MIAGLSSLLAGTVFSMAEGHDPAAGDPDRVRTVPVFRFDDGWRVDRALGSPSSFYEIVRIFDEARIGGEEAVTYGNRQYQAFEILRDPAFLLFDPEGSLRSRMLLVQQSASGPFLSPLQERPGGETLVEGFVDRGVLRRWGAFLVQAVYPFPEVTKEILPTLHTGYEWPIDVPKGFFDEMASVEAAHDTRPVEDLLSALRPLFDRSFDQVYTLPATSEFPVEPSGSSYALLYGGHGRAAFDIWTLPLSQGPGPGRRKKGKRTIFTLTWSTREHPLIARGKGDSLTEVFRNSGMFLEQPDYDRFLVSMTGHEPINQDIFRLVDEIPPMLGPPDFFREFIRQSFPREVR